MPNVADPLGVRDRALLELFYSCGLRRAELCRLELTDLNTERRTLTIQRGKGKKDRVVPVGARAVAWLERYLKEVRPRPLRRRPGRLKTTPVLDAVILHQPHPLAVRIRRRLVESA